MSKADNIDWSKSDAEVAKQLGISRSAANRRRHKLGIPPSDAKPDGEQTRRLVAEGKKVGKTAGEIAAELGMHPRHVARVARQIGYGREASPFLSRDKWLTDWDAVDWSKKNVQIAAETGAHPVNVSRMRTKFTKLGLIPPKRKKVGGE